MDTTFGEDIRAGWVIIYIDDIIIFSNDWPTHLQRLEIIFKKLASISMQVSMPKCNLGYSELRALGHKVSGLTLMVDDNKVAAVNQKPMPMNRKEMQSFLGFASYYSVSLLPVASHLTTKRNKNIVTLFGESSNKPLVFIAPLDSPAQITYR